MGNFFKDLERMFTGRPKPPKDPYEQGESGAAWLNQDLHNLQFDPNTGFPIGQLGPPPKQIALKVQQLAEQAAEERRFRYFGDAQGALEQGSRLMESYRPGGAASLASGMYQGRANLAYNIGAGIQAPDLLGGYREFSQMQADYKTEKSAARARTLQYITAIGKVAATVFSGGMAAPISAAGEMGSAAIQANANQGGEISGETGQVSSSAGWGQPAGTGSGGGAEYPGGPGGASMQAQSAPGGAAAAGGGTVLQSSLGGAGVGRTGSGTETGSGGGAGGAAGSGTGMKRLAGGGRGGLPGGSAGGAGGAGASGPPVGRFGQDGNFTSTALAASGARRNPAVEQIAALEYVENYDPTFVTAVDQAVNQHLNYELMRMVG